MSGFLYRNSGSRVGVRRMWEAGGMAKSPYILGSPPRRKMDGPGLFKYQLWSWVSDFARVWASKISFIFSVASTVFLDSWG